MKILGLALLAAAVVCAAEAPGTAVPLWPNGAPGAENRNSAEVVEGPDSYRDFKRISNVNNPSILVYLPPKNNTTGVGVIVAPGGAHRFLVIEKEGYEVAQWLNLHGIAAFVLKYRLANSPGSHYTVERDALADGNRAVRLVRSHASEWGLNPARIGFMGFSAGAEVAALAETRFDSGKADSADTVERVSSRPDFAVIVYPGFKPGSIHVPADAPPTFLVVANDDRSHVPATLEVYQGLFQQKIPAELHIFATGGHGFGMRDVHGAPVSYWDRLLLDWFKDQKILP